MKLGGEEEEDGSQVLEDGKKANTWYIVAFCRLELALLPLSVL